MKGFIILLLLLPGPFTATLFVGIIPDLGVWFFYSSIAGLVIAIYLIFRHTIIVNTPYEALKATLAVMNDVIIKMDNTFRIELVRGALSQMLGYEEKDLSGRSLSEIVQENNLLEAYRDYVFKGKMKESFFDAQVICKNGSLLPVFFSLTPIRAGMEVSGFVAVGRDITDLRQYERQLRWERDSLELRVQERTAELKTLSETLQKSLALQQRIVASLPTISFITTDINAIVTSFSPGAERIFGYRAEEMIGHPVVKLHLPEDVARFPEIIREQTEGRIDYRAEITMVRKNGERFPAEFITAPITNERGETVARLDVSQDISEQKKLNNNLSNPKKWKA